MKLFLVVVVAFLPTGVHSRQEYFTSMEEAIDFFHELPTDMGGYAHVLMEIQSDDAGRPHCVVRVTRTSDGLE